MSAVTRIAAVALVITVPMAGCAAGQRARRELGRLHEERERRHSPVQVTVNPDGTYTSRTGASSGTGTFQVVDGRVVTQGHLSGSAFGAGRRSVVRIVERRGQPVLSGEGRSDEGPYSFELTKRN